MRGELSILARLSDDSKVSFKITKEQFKSIFNNFKLLDEKVFLNLITEHGLYIKSEVTSSKHNDESSSKAFFAPFLLGLFFLDFKNKKVFSYNDLEAIFTLDSWFVRNEYLFLLAHAKKNNAGDILMYLKPTSLNISSYYLPYRIKTAVDNNAVLISRGRKVSYELGEKENIYTVLDNISNQSLTERSLEEVIALRKDLINGQDSGTGYEDVEISIPGWELKEGYGDEVYSVYKYCQEQKLLTEEENEYWKGYIKALDLMS